VTSPPVSRPRLAIHAHFYQPARLDPWTGKVPAEPSAAPFHDWNQRVDAECYRPNAERGNLRGISWNLGPTLATWLAAEDPKTHERFVADSATAIAQPYHHAILPLASAADRRTEIAWGIRDFELRFGRRPLGLWLPEAAVDLATLREAVAQGITFTILAPWQAGESGIDTRRLYRVDVGADRSIVVAFYDAALSSAVSFEPDATSDADRFARERVGARLRGGPAPIDAPLALIATDGELYGHHQQFRDLFLQRLVSPDPSAADRGFDIVALGEVVAAAASGSLPHARITERTSWSCHHGVARWSAECPDAADGRWKGPLRAAFERLAGAIDATTAAATAALPGDPDAAAARDAWIDVIAGATTADAFAAARWPEAGPAATRPVLALLEAQRWRLAMFASDGWYWDDPIRPETRQVMRAAARAARIVDEVAGSTLENRLVDDQAILSSPSRGLDGAAIYRMALSDIGQPPPGLRTP
jgi:hypothetical protein